MTVARLRAGGSTGARPGPASPPIIIGLVNSMPGEARQHTEQQFRTILLAAARNRRVELRFFWIDAFISAEADGAPPPRYDEISMLETAVPDGLIVTGMPPRAAALVDEPCWRKLTELVDLATHHAVPTVSGDSHMGNP